jgi:hypothetical protein
MDRSNSSDNPASPRATLKLKVPARNPARQSPPQPSSQPPVKVNPKSGARWSDEYKERMQMDMDALTSHRR